jgi:hypothetical protein
LIDEISIASIDHQYINIQIDGNIEVVLTYGSGADERNDQSATINHDLPFTCYIPASVDDLNKLYPDDVDLHIDISGWYGEDEVYE